MKKAKIKKCKLEVVGKRYHDITYGFFTVKKAWNVTRVNNNAINLDGTNTFRSVNILIITDDGVKYILPSYRIKDSMKQECPKRRKVKLGQ